MSIVGEIKDQIVQASQLLDDARSALNAAQEKSDSAIQQVNQAAGDSGHEKIDMALTTFLTAMEEIGESLELIIDGQDAANSYAEDLG